MLQRAKDQGLIDIKLIVDTVTIFYTKHYI